MRHGSSWRGQPLKCPVVIPLRASVETVNAVPNIGRILHRLWGRLQLFHPFRRQRRANQAASMFSHEVDGLRRDLPGRHHEIAFVLPILIIDGMMNFPGLISLIASSIRIERCRHIPRISTDRPALGGPANSFQTAPVSGKNRRR